MDNSPWFVTNDRALHIQSDGGCWVEISRIVLMEEIDRFVEQFDCSFYGPAEAWL